MSVLIIFLLLTAYFQSLRLALAVVATAPAVVAGVALALFLTGTTLNIQSFMGAIMAIGVATANAILLATFADRARREGAPASAAAVDGAQHRLRPILMTSFAMIAATLTTLVILPCFFAALLRGAQTSSVSLDPDDPQSPHYSPLHAARVESPRG
jgi:multidrug efflux pump subunit AcrB